LLSDLLGTREPIDGVGAELRPRMPPSHAASVHPAGLHPTNQLEAEPTADQERLAELRREL